MPENDVESTAASMGGDRGGAVDPLTKHLTAKHLQTFERQVRRRYPINEADRDRMVRACKHLVRTAKLPRTRLRAVSVLAALDAQSMRDEHHIEDKQHESGILDLRQRLREEGKPDQIIEHQVHVTPVRELPLPAALAEYRKRILEPSDS